MHAKCIRPVTFASAYVNRIEKEWDEIRRFISGLEKIQMIYMPSV